MTKALSRMALLGLEYATRKESVISGNFFHVVVINVKSLMLDDIQHSPQVKRFHLPNQLRQTEIQFPFGGAKLCTELSDI